MTLPLHPAPLLLIYPLISSLQSHWPLCYSSSELLHSHGFCLESPYPQSGHGCPSHGAPSKSITTPEAFLDQSMALSKGAPLPQITLHPAPRFIFFIAQSIAMF